MNETILPPARYRYAVRRTIGKFTSFLGWRSDRGWLFCTDEAARTLFETPTAAMLAFAKWAAAYGADNVGIELVRVPVTGVEWHQAEAL